MSSAVTLSSPRKALNCLHCGRTNPTGFSFCCAGCEAVYNFLSSQGLSQYYDLRNRFDQEAVVSREPRTRNFAHLDDPEFLALYSESTGEPRKTLRFFLEGTHCAACVWLTEQVQTLTPGVESVRLDLGNSVASISLGPTGKFSEVASIWSKMGYEPVPIRFDEHEVLRKKEDRSLLVKMGVAAAAAGNIMLLSISIYAGARGALARQFEWISGLLFLPVIFYSATPFFQSAWGSLRYQKISIDVPMALAIGIGGLFSYASLLLSGPHQYFDSLSTLTFLLLASRIALRKSQRSALQSSRVLNFLSPHLARLLSLDGTFQEVPVEQLHPGQLLEVRSGECFPVDGTIVRGSSWVDLSLLTGESNPVHLGQGNRVFAGTLNKSSPLQITVEKSGSQTRLGAILRQMEEQLLSRSQTEVFADRVARGFVWGSLALAVGVFAFSFLQGGLSVVEGLQRGLAVILVTCPCGYALATPLVFARSISRIASRGVLIKSPEALEKLAQASRIYLDKTGTLTVGKFTVDSFEFSRPELEKVVAALEARSTHPIAHAILEKWPFPTHTPQQELEVQDFQEIAGLGVSGTVDGKSYEIVRDVDSAPFGAGATPITRVALIENGGIVGRIALTDCLREESAQMVARLQRMGIDVWLLSGDSEAASREAAKAAGIPQERVLSGVSPENKAVIASGHVMVGDGANDAVALASASVGIAVHGGMEVSLKAASIYFSRPGVAIIPELIVAARETIDIAHRNFTVSLIYNLFGATAAVSGKVSPLFAAVLMPLSAFSVLALTWIGTPRLNRIFSRSITRSPHRSPEGRTSP